MSTRERWVVYPLLLFAFLMGARDKYVKPEHVSYSTVNCKALTVTSIDGHPLVTIRGTADDAGEIVLHSSSESNRLPGEDPEAQSDLRAPGYRTVELAANDDGGYVRVFGARAGTDLHVGHDAATEMSGYFAIDEHDQFVAQTGIETPSTTENDLWGTTLSWAHRNTSLHNSDEANLDDADETESDTANSNDADATVEVPAEADEESDVGADGVK